MIQQLVIDGWHPTLKNVLIRLHWSKRNKAVQGDKAVVFWAARAQGLTKAAGKRYVTLLVRHTKNAKVGDPDAFWPNINDGLVAAGLLVDDNKDWLKLGGVTFEVAHRKGVVVTLEDLA